MIGRVCTAPGVRMTRPEGLLQMVANLRAAHQAHPNGPRVRPARQAAVFAAAAFLAATLAAGLVAVFAAVFAARGSNSKLTLPSFAS